MDGALGLPRALTVTFGYALLNEVERIYNKDLGGSVLMDIGMLLWLGGRQTDRQKLES